MSARLSPRGLMIRACKRNPDSGAKRPIFILIALLIFAVAAIGLSGCTRKGPARQVAAQKSGGTLNFFLGNPVSIDPAHAQEGEGLQVVKQVFDGLIDYNPKTLAVEPAIAERWRSNKAGDVWTFWIREGARFHNGRRLRASDFVYSWNRVAAKKTASPVAYLLAPIKGFDAVQSGKKKTLSGVSSSGRYKLRVKLNYPFADFPKVLGHPVFSPVPKEEIEKNAEGFAEKPIGNGPFMMSGPWKQEQEIQLTRFKRHYGDKPFLDNVNFKITKDEQTAFLQFQGGALDYSPIPSGQVKQVGAQMGKLALIGQPQLVLQFYGFNLRSAPFKDNPELRRAINYAVNRSVIAEKIYEGTHVKAGGIVPPGIDKFYQEPEHTYVYSKKKAAKLLKAAGHPRGRGLGTIKLVYPAGRGHEGPAQVFQENLRELGVKVSIRGLGFGAFINAMRSGKMSMFAASWQGDYPSRDTFLYSLFHSKSGDNMLGFADKEVDKLLIEARQSLDSKKRRQLYQKAEEKILAQAPIVPITFAGTRIVLSANVNGFQRTALDDTPLNLIWLSK